MRGGGCCDLIRTVQPSLLGRIRGLFAAPPISSALALTPRLEPFEPFEHDYLWDKPKLGAAPERVHYRDLPIIGGVDGFDDVAAVKSALYSMSAGHFEPAARLCDEFRGDDRIGALLETRIEALASLPVEVTASKRTGKKKKAQKVAEEVEGAWSTWFPAAEAKKLHEWGLNLGFGISELIWDTSEGQWAPSLKTWDLRYCYWRWDTRSFWLITMDGNVEVHPGDGHWVVYAPHGYARSWMFGLARPFALQYLTRRWTARDWARWCEIHGMPIRLGIVPAEGVEDPVKRSFINDLLFLGGEAVVRAEQDQTGHGFDVRLIEAASQSWQGFQKFLEKVDENLAVRVLGQNLTTSAKAGGSYALGDVHDRIRSERTEGDATSIGACFTEQVVKPWAVYNYGDALLAPSATWSTRPPEDRAATAKTFLDAGNALKTLRSGGLNVDREQFAKAFRIPLVDGDPLIEPEPMAPGAPPVAAGAANEEPPPQGRPPAPKPRPAESEGENAE